MIKYFFAFILFCSTICVHSQTIGVNVNYGLSDFSFDKLESDSGEITYLTNATVSLNLRYFTRTRWAIRLGAERDNVSYEFGNQTSAGIDTFYDAKRTDYVALIGFEKHFLLADFIDLYPGIVVPITFTGEEETIGDTFAALNIEDVFASPGLVLGASLKFLKIFRLGLEGEMTYDAFKVDILGTESVSNVNFSDLDYTTSLTFGVAF